MSDNGSEIHFYHGCYKTVLYSTKVKIKNEKMNESIKRLHKSGSFRAILKTFYLVNNSSLYFGRGHISSSTSISKWSM